MPPIEPLRLVTLAPGHFHAALVHRHRHPDVDRRVTVFAPDDDDTVLHVARVAAFNARPDNPTDWEVDVRTGPAYLDRFGREVTPGSAVVLAGRNAPKIDLIRAAVRAGCHVLADKPWVIDAGGYAQLPDVLRDAEVRGVVVSDLMTERHEVTATLLRDLLRQPDIVGDLRPGTAEPTVLLHSLHYLMKTVAGQPLRRPAWWFDADVAGSAVADVGTHLVDLALWLLFPGRHVSPAEITGLMTGMAWPTEVSRSQFARMTGLSDFPPHLRERWKSGGVLQYQGNGMFALTACGIHGRVLVNWAVERGPDDPPEGNEIHVRGTNAVVTARSVAALTDTDRPELRVIPTAPGRRAATVVAVRRWCDSHGLAVEDRGPHLSVAIPDRLVTPHESHFREVFDGFVRRIRNPAADTDPENLLAKYLVTTTAADPAGRP